MPIKRIVVDLATPSPDQAREFYQTLFDLEPIMNQGWIQTLSVEGEMPIQLTVASEGGSGTPVPNLSIEVTDVNAVLQRAIEAGIDIEYGPVDEPWGVRRFYLKDPMGNLINVLEHM